MFGTRVEYDLIVARPRESPTVARATLLNSTMGARGDTVVVVAGVEHNGTAALK